MSITENNFSQEKLISIIVNKFDMKIIYITTNVFFPNKKHFMKINIYTIVLLV